MGPLFIACHSAGDVIAIWELIGGEIAGRLGQAGIDTAFRRCFLSPPHSGHRSKTTEVTCRGGCRVPRWLLMCLIPVMSFPSLQGL